MPVAVAVGLRRDVLGRCFGARRICRTGRGRARGARAGRRTVRVYAISLEARRILITNSLARVHRFLGPLLMLIDSVLLLELF